MRLSDLREFSAHSPQDSLRFMLFQWRVSRPSYADWADAVEGCIEFSMQQMSIRKNDIQDMSEDALTALLTSNLSCFGLNAASARVGGNCDVTVGYDSYLWLGEAKLFTGVAHVWDGYLQLTTRYNTGLVEHGRGGMLLYCYKDSAGKLLAEWRAVLGEQLDGICIEDGARELTFLSDQSSPATGGNYRVTHFAFPLHHAPSDGKVKLSAAAMAAGREAKRAFAASETRGVDDQAAAEG